MRWLFLFLLSLNLAYIAWEVMHESDGTYADVRPLQNVQSIALLSEVKKGNPEELLSSEQKPGEKSKESSLSTDVDPEPVTAESPAETMADVPVKPESLPREQVSQTSSCFTLGPFRSLDKLRSFIREIKSYVVTADFRGREEKEQVTHWVFIQPEANYKKAAEIGKRLKAKGIKDFYIISDDDKLHGISLGRFRNKVGAYGLAKKVKNLGFDVTVEPIFKRTTIYWLDYQLIEGAKIPEAIFDKYIQTKNKNKISRLSRQCAE